MKSTVLALAAVVAALSACHKDNAETARQAESFESQRYSTTVSSTGGVDRVGVDVDVDRTKNGVDLDADGYRVDDRGQKMNATVDDGSGTLGQRVGTTIDDGLAEAGDNARNFGDRVESGIEGAGERISKGVDRLGNKIGSGIENVGERANDASSDAVAAGHKADNGAKTGKSVGDLDLGRSLNAKGDVSDRTQQFKVGDAVVASIDADNLDDGATLTALWKDKAGKVIAKDSATVKHGVENASFELGTARVAGDYTLTISGPQGEIESQSFSVDN